MKTKILAFYYRNGVKAGKFLLVSTLFSTVIAVAMIVLGKFNVVDSLAMIFAIPMLALIVTITRLLLLLFYRRGHMQSLIMRVIVSVIVFAICGIGISPLFRALDGLSEFVLGIIFIGYDIVFIGIMVLLLMANHLERKANTNTITEDK